MLCSYEQIREHVRQHTNYGVLCGYGGLAVPDADRPELEEAIASCLPETMTVRTGGGGAHFYFLCPELHRRIVLQRDGIHYGEVQSFSQQVVGSGSVHPNGCRYEVVKDLAIQHISCAHLVAAISPFMKEAQPRKALQLPPRQFGSHTGIRSIQITTVIDIREFERAPNGELYGPNPWHGSTTGMNTWVNEQKNVTYCFRHNTGIGVVKAIALNHRLINQCDDRMTRADFARVMEIAELYYCQFS